MWYQVVEEDVVLEAFPYEFSGGVATVAVEEEETWSEEICCRFRYKNLLKPSYTNDIASPPIL